MSSEDFFGPEDFQDKEGHAPCRDYLETRVCHKCDKEWDATPNDPDPCWGMLPGVVSACCGHGEYPGYIKFEDGTVIGFDDVEISRE